MVAKATRPCWITERFRWLVLRLRLSRRGSCSSFARNGMPDGSACQWLGIDRRLLLQLRAVAAGRLQYNSSGLQDDRSSNMTKRAARNGGATFTRSGFL